MSTSIALNASAEKSKDLSTQRTSVHIVCWNQNSYRISLKDISSKSNPLQLSLTGDQWSQFDTIFLDTLNKVNSVAGTIFKPGIPSFAIQATLQELAVSYKDNQHQEQTLSLESEKEHVSQWSKAFFEGVQKLGTFESIPLPATSAPAAPIPATNIPETSQKQEKPEETPSSSIPFRDLCFQDLKYNDEQGKEKEDKRLSGQTIILGTKALQVQHGDNSLIISQEKQAVPLEISYPGENCEITLLTPEQKQQISASKQNVFIPLHSSDENHFTLLYRVKGQWYYYDSMLKSKEDISAAKMQAMQTLLELKNPLFRGAIKIVIPSDQNNDKQYDLFNCGTFVIRKIESFMTNPERIEKEISLYRHHLAERIEKQYSTAELKETLQTLSDNLPPVSIRDVALSPTISAPSIFSKQAHMVLKLCDCSAVDIIPRLPRFAKTLCCHWQSPVSHLLTCSQIGLLESTECENKLLTGVRLLRDRTHYYRPIKENIPIFDAYSIAAKPIIDSDFVQPTANNDPPLTDEAIKTLTEQVYNFLQQAISQNYDILIVPEYPISSELSQEQKRSFRQKLAEIYKELLTKHFYFFAGHIYFTQNDSCNEVISYPLYDRLKPNESKNLFCQQLTVLSSDQFTSEPEKTIGTDPLSTSTEETWKIRKLHQEMNRLPPSTP